MRNVIKVLTLCAVLGLTVGGSTAQASPAEWSYNWQTNTSQIFAGEVGVGSGVTVSDELGATAAGSSDIVATNLTVFSDAPRDTPAILDARGNFTLRMELTDAASTQKTTLSFNLKLTGPISEDSADIDLAFLSPLQQTVVLGENEYTVEIGPYSPPGPPSADNSGSIAAHVEVREAPPIEEAPEPSTMVLSGIGLSLIGLGALRTRRKRRIVAEVA